MRHALVAVFTTLVLAFGSAFAVVAFNPEPPPAAAATLIDCELVVGQQTRVICTLAGEVLLNTVVDLPTVTLPPLPQATVTAPGVTVTLPPATQTITPPRATETVRIPLPPVTVTAGPNATATVTLPGSNSTTTVTLPPKAGSTITKTVRPNDTPVPTETVTTTETATGQPQPESATVDPSGSEDDFLRFDLDLGDDSVSAGEAGVGLLGALLILLAIWAGMTYGYRRGRVSAEVGESNFLRDLLDNNKTS